MTTISTRPDPQDNRRQQLFARVQNFSDAAAQAHRHDLRSTARRSRSATSTWRPTDRASRSSTSCQPARARPASAIANKNGDNGLTLDDTAYAVLVQRKPAQVLLVSAGNQFLEKVLTLLPNVDLYRISSQRYLAVEADRFDIIVFDNYLPPLLPRGNLLVVNPPDRGPYRTSGSGQPPAGGDLGSRGPDPGVRRHPRLERERARPSSTCRAGPSR